MRLRRRRQVCRDAYAAVWFKYPNPFAEHVQSIDVLNRTICPHTGVLRTERIMTVEQSTPKWIKQILGIDGATYVREVITVDPHVPAVRMDSTKYVLGLTQPILQRVPAREREYPVPPGRRGGCATYPF